MVFVDAINQVQFTQVTLSSIALPGDVRLSRRLCEYGLLSVLLLLWKDFYRNCNFLSINTLGIFHKDLLNEFLEAHRSFLGTKLQIYFINDVFFLPASSPFYDLWERVDGTKRAIVSYET